MNERIIKELQLAAMHSVWDGHDPAGDVDKMYIPAEFTKKFAELIVRECVDYAFHSGDDVSYLFKHFGVEE